MQLDWTVMRLPGGKKSQAFRTYVRNDPVGVLVNAYGHALLAPNLLNAAEQAKQMAAQQKKAAKEQVGKLLDGGILNAADAEIARHFSYGGKIKRIYVTGGQLSALNAGELGVVQYNGRYCLTPRETVLAVRALLPSLVALYCDGNEEVLPEGYDDPKFQVPDNLIW